MDTGTWDAPRTEEGLQQVLRQLEEYRRTDDYVEIGKGLLKLSHLVKWVRSDTATSPFERSHELALEALEAFRRGQDPKGQAKALVAASVLSSPEAREAMLSEAERLMESSEDENDVALVLAARARALALSDRVQARELHLKVLDIYRRTGDQLGQAMCLFCLSVGTASNEEKLGSALEAARLYRENGDPEEASRCVTVAFMNAERFKPLSELEGLARQGLEDAWAAGHRGQEGRFYEKLALVYAAKGEAEEASKYRRFAGEIQEADGLTPLERWERDVVMTKMMVQTAKTQGNKEGLKMFKEELKRLKASKPKRK